MWIHVISDCLGRESHCFTRSAFFLILIFCIWIGCFATDPCSVQSFAPNKVLSLKENVPAGTSIFSFEVNGQVSWSYSLRRTSKVDGSAWSDLKTYLAFKRFGNKYEMIVNKSLDLEDIYRKHSIALSTLMLTLNCQRPNLPVEKEEVLLQVIPVNEFAPKFIGAPYHLTVSENTPIGTEIIRLRDKAVDNDVNPFANELSQFGIHDFINGSQRDGQSYFGMKVVQNGIIVLEKPIDFEALESLGVTRFALNVSASDTGGLKTYTEIYIDLINVDDLPPEFLHPGCPERVRRPRPCLVSFEAIISVGFQGPVRTISPQAITAHDMDGLNAPITYSLYNGPGESKENLAKFAIDKSSGALTVISPFMQEMQVDLVVVATENTTKAMVTQAPLKVTVQGVSNSLTISNELTLLTTMTSLQTNEAPDLTTPTVTPTRPQRSDASTEKKTSATTVSNENVLRANTSSLGLQDDRNTDDNSNNDRMFFLIILIVLTSVIILLILVMVIIIVKLKYPRVTTATVHPLANGDYMYDEPSSYHLSRDEDAGSKGTNDLSRMPSIASHRSHSHSHKGSHHRQDSDRNTESQMPSQILSSRSHHVRRNERKAVQAMVEKETAAMHYMDAVDIRTVKQNRCLASSQTPTSDNEKMTSSSQTSANSSPKFLDQTPEVPSRDIPSIVYSRGDSTPGLMNDTPAPLSALNKEALRELYVIEGKDQNRLVIPALEKGALTDPIARPMTGSEDRDKSQMSSRSTDGRLNKSQKRPGTRKKEVTDNESSEITRSRRSSRAERRIRIPSGVLVRKSSCDDNALFSGDDSSASTLRDEPEIDVFCESPSISINLPTSSKSSNEKNVAVKPSALDHGEVMAKPNRGKLVSFQDFPSVPKDSIRNLRMDGAANGRPQNLNVYCMDHQGLQSHSQGSVVGRPRSILSSTENGKAVIALRSVSEADALIRRKKKRRRLVPRQPEVQTTSGSNSQRDDRDKSKKNVDASPNTQPVWTSPSSGDQMNSEKVSGRQDREGDSPDSSSELDIT